MSSVASLVKHGFVKRHAAGGLRIWAREDCPVEISPDLLREHMFHGDDHGRSDVSIFKTTERLSVSKVATDGCDLLFKTFRFATLWGSRKYKNYALSEAIHNLQAEAMGFSVPWCYAYFEYRSRGFVRHCGVITECLSDYVEIGDYYESAEDLLESTIPFLVKCYNEGVNYIDVSPKNVMIHPETQKTKIIDWQYCRFLSPRSDIQLVTQAINFWNILKYFNYDGVVVDGVLWKQWGRMLHERSKTKMPMVLLFQNLAQLEGKRLHRADRLTRNYKRLGIVRG